MRRYLAVLAVALLVASAAFGVTKYTGASWVFWVQHGLFVGSASSQADANMITKSLGASATIDFASSAAAPVDSNAITVTGAAAGDPCEVGVPTAAGALKAQYTCYVSATDAVKVKFKPVDVATGAATVNADAGVGVTVSANSTCVCHNTTDASHATLCTVSSTTLLVASTATDVVTYSCAAPVDPASGTYYVRVTSSQ